MIIHFAGKLCDNEAEGAVWFSRRARRSLAISVICTEPPFENVCRRSDLGVEVVSRLVISSESR